MTPDPISQPPCVAPRSSPRQETRGRVPAPDVSVLAAPAMSADGRGLLTVPDSPCPASRLPPIGPSAAAAVSRTGATWRAYLELCKPRVVSLVVFTAVVSMCLAIPDGHLPWGTLLAGTLGIALGAASAAVLNQVADRDIDAVMRRTHRRPLPTRTLGLSQALPFAAVLGGAAVALLWLLVNPLTAVLSLVSLIGYSVVYTRWLKWSTPQNIVLGGASGAAPAILGWTAATGEVQTQALALFLIVFVWTPPHFWPLAIARRDDYAAAGVPMLPVTHGIEFTRGRILAYTLALVPVSLTPCIAGLSGPLYAAGALGLGALFVRRAWIFRQGGGAVAAMGLFRWSITYLSALFALMLADRWLGVLLGF